jgi:hypothetical protein
MIKYFSILILLAFLSCKQDNLSFDIGGKYIDVKTNLRYVDSLTVNSYTVKLDSLRTSGLADGEGAILAGRYHDPEIGDIQASSYFRVGLPGLTIPFNAVYDSLSLIMIDNNYSIGDTLKPLTLHVHRLSQTLKAGDDGFLYNTSLFSYYPEPMGSVTYRPRPITNDTISIKLDNAFGKELFNLFLTKDDRVLQTDNFLNYFKGMTLRFDPSDEAIVGFKTSVAMPTMRLYYHYFDFSDVFKHLDFTIRDYTSLQYNQISVLNQVINLPAQQKDNLPVHFTDNQSYLQGGTGIVTRLEIPYLKNMLGLYENMKILRAELIIEPVRNTYKIFPLPKRVSLYSTDRLNRFGTPIVNNITGSVVVGSLVIDDVYQEATSYTFDITDFIATKITEASDDLPALLVTITPNDIYRTLDRLVVGSQPYDRNKVKLKIYYMNY